MEWAIKLEAVDIIDLVKVDDLVGGGLTLKHGLKVGCRLDITDLDALCVALFDVFAHLLVTAQNGCPGKLGL